MAIMSMQNERKYVSLAIATKTAKVTIKRVKEWAEAGLIGVQTLPGCPPRYSIDDLLALKAKHSTIGKLTVEPMAMAS